MHGMSDTIYSQPALPPELVASVFRYLPLKDLLPFRHVSTRWTEMVDAEAKVRMLRLATDVNCPLVLQAGPPAIYDVCEYLPLTFLHFSSGHQTSQSRAAPLLATLTISHSLTNPCHTSSMASDVNQAFQNIILSITRRENKYRQRPARFSTEGATGGTIFSNNWTNWEVARATDRLWREWWEQTGPALTSVDTEDNDVEQMSVEESDSGFAEVVDMFDGIQVDPAAKTKAKLGYSSKSLDIHKTISGATLQVCRRTAEHPSGEIEERHEYQWQSVHLDVYRVLLAFEERARRTGMSAILQTAFIA